MKRILASNEQREKRAKVASQEGGEIVCPERFQVFLLDF
jgi:hypothetical protein